MDSAGTSETWGHAGKRQVLVAALLALSLGLAVYVLDRPPGSAYFLPPVLSLAGTHLWFGALGAQLPEFVHVYVFSLFTALILGSSRRALLTSCLTWWAIDSFFEIGQHPLISPHIAAAVPAWFAGIPFLENTAPYFARGTFDPGDLVAIAIGALMAYLTVGVIRRKELSHVHIF
ncbi:MAG: hypothetical protein AMS22_17040 [Thiotrichales bacterium SG8_50]|jgi:hypothetical protein|nr:MAG: hypothetical protein AMS22_17040 [Thiotrichales bacterium SG8_50]